MGTDHIFQSTACDWRKKVFRCPYGGGVYEVPLGLKRGREKRSDLRNLAKESPDLLAPHFRGKMRPFASLGPGGGGMQKRGVRQGESARATKREKRETTTTEYE